MSYRLDPKAGLILVKAKLYGPRGDAVVNLALDTGATWTLVSWETAVLVGYDPAAIQQRTPITTGSGVEFLCRDGNGRRRWPTGSIRLHWSERVREERIRWMNRLHDIGSESLVKKCPMMQEAPRENK